jgi:hypothetical protein
MTGRGMTGGGMTGGGMTGRRMAGGTATGSGLAWPTGTGRGMTGRGMTGRIDRRWERLGWTGRRADRGVERHRGRLGRPWVERRVVGRCPV